MKSYKFIDLFSGIGGFRIALTKYGGNCVFSSDNDVHANKTYLLNFHETPAGDITKIKAEDIPDHDILTAGFPCQAFSVAGRRLGFQDTRGTLFFDVVRILKAKQPKSFILENVAGLVSHDQGNTLAIIEMTLRELGYVFCWSLLNARDYGVPQNRNRWYCVGLRKDVAKSLNLNEDSLKKAIMPEKEKLRTHLEDLLEEEPGEDNQISDIAIKNIKKNLSSYKSLNKDHVLIANHIRPSKVSFSSSGVSPCLTAKMGTGGNNVPVIVRQNRRLTIRECLRIMGFPDDYQMTGSSSQSYKQIGNSVVVPVLEKLAANLTSVLNKVKD